jgi:hypothetical protein
MRPAALYAFHSAHSANRPPLLVMHLLPERHGGVPAERESAKPAELGSPDEIFAHMSAYMEAPTAAQGRIAPCRATFI